MTGVNELPSGYITPTYGGNVAYATNANDSDLLDGQHGSYYAKAADVTTLQGYFTNGVANNAGIATRSKFVFHSGIGAAAYVSGDTHIMYLGYLEVSNYGNTTLMISSSFWGNQHNSVDLITIANDFNTNGDTLTQATVQRVMIGGSYERKFFCKKETNGNILRVHLTVYVEGGNSYGNWYISIPNSNDGALWHTDGTKNYNNTGFSEIPFSGKVSYALNAGSATKLQTPRTIWGQSFDGSGNVSGTFYFTNGDATMKIYGAASTQSSYGNERVAIQTSFDGQDPLTSSYPSTYPDRSALLLQPRGGNVGIGTTSPSYKLDVNGTLHASGATTLSSTLYVGNNATIAGTLGVFGTTTLKSGLTLEANAYISGEVFFSAVDAFRLNYGSYGVIHRNDGGSYWILLTDKNNQDGGFNNLRPFHIDLSTGTVYMDNNAIIDNLAFTQCNISMGGRVNATWGYDLNTSDYYGLYFKSKNSDSTGILFNDDGNVGINTISP
jgi:hypothetical protein